MLLSLHSCMMKAVSEYPTRNGRQFLNGILLALTHPISYNHPVAHLLTLQSRLGLQTTFEDQRNVWIVYMTDFKNLRKIWDWDLIATLHAIELVLNEYILRIYQQKNHGQNVF